MTDNPLDASQLLHVGDVIRASPGWEIGVILSSTQPDLVAVADDPKATGMPQRPINISEEVWKEHFERNDPTRVQALFVVERAERTAEYADHYGWGVTARRLNADGAYNPEGEQIFFHETGGGGAFNCMAKPAKVGEMRRVVTFVPVDQEG